MTDTTPVSETPDPGTVPPPVDPTTTDLSAPAPSEQPAADTTPAAAPPDAVSADPPVPAAPAETSPPSTLSDGNPAPVPTAGSGPGGNEALVETLHAIEDEVQAALHEAEQAAETVPAGYAEVPEPDGDETPSQQL